MGHADELFKKAELAIKKQNHEYAVELIQQGLIVEPDHPKWRRRLHQVATLVIQENGGNPQGGLGVKLKVMKPEANAKKLRLQKKHDLEVNELENSLKHQPQNSSTLSQLARALESCELWESAIGVYEEIVELDSSAIEALRSLGKLVASKRDDPESAIAYWETLKNQKPDDKEAGKFIRDLSAAVMVRKAEKKKKQAGDDSFRSMLKDEDESAELEQKQQIIRTDEDRVRAIKFKMTDIKQDPKNSRLWREVGSLFQDLKQWDKAETAYRNALKVNSTDLFAQEKIEQLKEVRLETELTTLREKANSDHSLKGPLEEKEKEFMVFQVSANKRRCETHPTDYGLKFAYGLSLKAIGEYDDAIGQFQQSMKDPKNKIGAKKEIGDCFIAKELPDMAKSQYSEALGDLSDKESDLFKNIKYALGRACEDNNDVDEALKHYQELMSIDIGFKDVSKRVSDLRTKNAS